MKIRNFHIVFAGAMLLLSVSCSMNKNTWKTRSFQALNTRYNVYFNGKTAYREGLKNIAVANKEDYSNVIHMYPISRHDNANSAKSNMDRAIEKCRKAIKQRSIKKKPERNLKKWNDPVYRTWYNQEEFNPALKEAWLLLAQSEFHKADFIGSVGTFTYIARHYSGNKDVVAECQLWIARAYAEMGWLYEAEQVLGKLKQADLNDKNTGLFAAVSSDVLLKKDQYKDAIPYLELALKKEKDKTLRQRFGFLLGQLYMKNGNQTDAYDAFTKVIKSNPDYEMEFNARIYRAELDTKNVAAVRKELNKMLKNANNKDYLDQIYFAIGKTYLQQGDTTKAIELFKQSAEKSTRNGFDKAVTLITMADLYYNKQQYVKAQPCYDEASKIITIENDDYPRVSKRAETLSELVSQYETYALQDSLQHLATLPEDKRKEIVNNIIDKIKADEKKAAEDEKIKEQLAMNEPDLELRPPIGGIAGSSGDWYFYNTNLIKAGQSAFNKKWGKRKLEDNWRRTTKSAVMFSENAAPAATQQTTTDEQPGTTPDGTTPDQYQLSEKTDKLNPEFYLRQIPTTAAQMEKSNTELATALFNMGVIYKEKVEDYPMAIKTFEEFEKRFPADPRQEEAYFQCYMMETKSGNASGADVYKNKIIAQFPKSKYAEVLSQPDYVNRMARMYAEQDSLYTVAYTAYNASKFADVIQNAEYVEKNYPLSSLLPKFQFLKALSIGKTDKPDKFETALSSVVEKYPDSDVSAMSKDILALIKQGREAKTGTSHGSLLSRREDIVKQEFAQVSEKELSFSADKTLKHRLVLISDSNKLNVNKLLYDIAAYNFTRFMVKDFDLVIAQPDSARTAISVTNFDSYDETEWYVNSIDNDPTLSALMAKLNVRKIIISEQNFGLINLKGWNAYQNFQQQYLLAKGGKKAVDVNPDMIAMKNVDPTIITNQGVPVPVPVKDRKTTEKSSGSSTLQPAVVTQTNTSATSEADAKNEKTPETIAENKPVNSLAKTDDKTTAASDIKTVPAAQPTQPVTPPVVQPKEDNVPLFKNLFGYRANEPHYVAIVVMSGTFDFVKLKAAFDAYNAQNYGILNLKLSNESYDKQQVVIIGSFADANIAKSYLLRMVKEKTLFDNLKGTDYRNVLGSQKNLNIMMQQNAMKTYFEFMQQYYLK